MKHVVAYAVAAASLLAQGPSPVSSLLAPFPGGSSCSGGGRSSSQRRATVSRRAALRGDCCGCRSYQQQREREQPSSALQSASSNEASSRRVRLMMAGGGGIGDGRGARPNEKWYDRYGKQGRKGLTYNKKEWSRGTINGRLIESIPGGDKKSKGAKGLSGEGRTPSELLLESGARLQKVLAHAGVDSRRNCEVIISKGRVKVNGRVVTIPGTKVDPSKDVLQVDGKRVQVRTQGDRFWVALYKPKGVISSLADERGRKTIVDLIPGAARMRLLPVGRLDRDSAGLMVMTNENAWLNVLTHPRYGHEKVYRVSIMNGQPTDKAWQLIINGMLLPGEKTKTAPCTVELLEFDRGLQVLHLDITLTEGRNRQLRRMFEAIGHPIRSITRTRVGPLKLKGMYAGEWRQLTPYEITKIKTAGRRSISKSQTRANVRDYAMKGASEDKVKQAKQSLEDFQCDDAEEEEDWENYFPAAPSAS